MNKTIIVINPYHHRRNILDEFQSDRLSRNFPAIRNPQKIQRYVTTMILFSTSVEGPIHYLMGNTSLPLVIDSFDQMK